MGRGGRAETFVPELDLTRLWSGGGDLHGDQVGRDDVGAGVQVAGGRFAGDVAGPHRDEALGGRGDGCDVGDDRRGPVGHRGARTDDVARLHDRDRPGDIEQTGCSLVKAPARPALIRVSSTRVGVIGTNTDGSDAARTEIKPPAPNVTAIAAPIAAHRDRHNPSGATVDDDRVDRAIRQP